MDAELNVDEFTEEQRECFTKKELKRLKDFYKRCVAECNVEFEDSINKAKNREEQKMNIRNMIIQDFEECGLYDANHLYCVGKALVMNC
jgi:hypothetical protein